MTTGGAPPRPLPHCHRQRRLTFPLCPQSRISRRQGFNHRLAASVRALADLRHTCSKGKLHPRAGLKKAQSLRPLRVHIPHREPIKLEEQTITSSPDLLNGLKPLPGHPHRTRGRGKSRAVAQCAKALGLPFTFQTPSVNRLNISGHKDAHGVFHETHIPARTRKAGFCSWTRPTHPAPMLSSPQTPSSMVTALCSGMAACMNNTPISALS